MNHCIRKKKAYSPIRFHSNVRKICVSLLCFLVTATGALSQEAKTDSSEQVIDEAVYYSITKTRLIRWARAEENGKEKELLLQVIELLEDAETFAKDGDFETAQLYIDTGLEIAQESLDRKAEPAAIISSSPVPKTKSRSQFRPEITSGFDFWRQEFELSFLTVSDTTFFESAGNPYTGLKLRSTHQTKNFGEVTANFLVKASRDYVTGDFDFRQRAGKTSDSHFGFENRLEWTRYRNGLSLEFVENTAKLNGTLELARDFSLNFADELKIRKYALETDLFPNYFQNLVSGGFQYQSSLSARFSGKYSFVIRSHPTFSFDNYNEHRLDASIYQVTAANSSIALENSFYKRDYVTLAASFDPNNVESFRFLRKDYRENYLRADFQFGFTRSFSFDLKGDFNQRNYELADAVTPDFRNFTANPQFLLKLSNEVEAGAGYLYVSRSYQIDANPASVDAANGNFGGDVFLLSEDYYAHGFSVSLELFRAGKFMLNLTENFEVRTYPNSITGNISNFGLYTDRIINSVFLFLSWQALPQLEVSVIANYDQDRSRNQDHSDSRNTLFSLDFAYRLNN